MRNIKKFAESRSVSLFDPSKSLGHCYIWISITAIEPPEMLSIPPMADAHILPGWSWGLPLWPMASNAKRQKRSNTSNPGCCEVGQSSSFLVKVLYGWSLKPDFPRQPSTFSGHRLKSDGNLPWISLDYGRGFTEIREATLLLRMFQGFQLIWRYADM